MLVYHTLHQCCARKIIKLYTFLVYVFFIYLFFLLICISNTSYWYNNLCAMHILRCINNYWRTEYIYIYTNTFLVDDNVWSMNNSTVFMICVYSIAAASALLPLTPYCVLILPPFYPTFYRDRLNFKIRCVQFRNMYIVQRKRRVYANGVLEYMRSAIKLFYCPPPKFLLFFTTSDFSTLN